MKDGASFASVAAVGVVGLVGLVGLGACVAPDSQPYADDGLTPVPGVVDLVIDSGGQAQLDPGSGIAVTVAYAEGGHWSITTACDTLLSDIGCNYDISASTDESAPITVFEGVGLEEDDRVSAPDDFAVTAELSTADDTDGFGFTTSPGATVRVSALLYDPGLDSRLAWSDDPRFISWVGDGAVHQGAPTNPVDLTPDRP